MGTAEQEEEFDRDVVKHYVQRIQTLATAALDTNELAPRALVNIEWEADKILKYMEMFEST